MANSIANKNIPIGGCNIKKTRVPWVNDEATIASRNTPLLKREKRNNTTGSITQAPGPLRYGPLIRLVEDKRR
jgi:hypothetical protein